MNLFNYKCVYCKRRIGAQPFRGAGKGTDIAAQQKFAHDKCYVKNFGRKEYTRLKSAYKKGIYTSLPGWDTVEGLIYYIDDLKKEKRNIKKEQK